MPDFTDTRMWEETLDARPRDDAAEARDYLRSAYLGMRDRAVAIARAIAEDLPDFTVHDESHFDAMWEMASLATATETTLTPVEGFVLGGAFLIHDLGMGVAAFPGGVDGLKAQTLWRDSVALVLRNRLGRSPLPAEIDAPDEEVERIALAETLRTLHADQAERLASSPWTDESGTERFLIEPVDLRETYGHLIGSIARSHWWPASELRTHFSSVQGAPAWTSPPCPVDWTLDPLRVAAILRVADAIHLDSRRAPRFLRTVRRPSGLAARHWTFQAHLNRPIIEQERVVFTASTPFTKEDAPAWWTCYDTLHQVDDYLLEVDSVLSASGRSRLRARGVAALESPKHLAERIPTVGWTPINTQVHVSDVARLVENLGGEELYGKNAPVALRELMQNAGDAIRARRILQSKPADWGTVAVRLSTGDEPWLEVEDDGVGMSPEVLTDVLLDFGRSFWESPLVAQELPGLMGTGFAPTGKYGIGFFSVLMLGERLRVITRRFDAAARDTNILEFNSGLGERPLLRTAEDSEVRQDGGTTVRVWLREDPLTPFGLLHRWSESAWTLSELVESLAPAVDVDVRTEEANVTADPIKASDWRTTEPENLLRRCVFPGDERKPGYQRVLELADNMREVRANDGEVIGRAFINPGSTFVTPGTPAYTGAVTVGGLRATPMDGIGGVLTGDAERAVRDVARPHARGAALAAWATEQASLVANCLTDPELQSLCATIVATLGGDTGDLTLVESSEGWLTSQQLQNWAASRNDVVMLSGFDIQRERERGSTIALLPNVLVQPLGQRVIVESSNAEYIDWPLTEFFVADPWAYSAVGREDQIPDWVWTERNSGLGLVIQVLAEAWSADPVSILERAQIRFSRGEMITVGERDGGEFLTTPDVIYYRPAN